MKQFGFVILIGLFSFAAHAQTNCVEPRDQFIFLDFNNSENEIRQTRTGAEAQCKRFHLVRSKESTETLLRDLEGRSGGVHLALSGHSGAMGFSGNNFSMNREELMQLVDKYPSVKERTKTLYLLGCYTNNLSKLRHWLRTLPRLNRVYGYDLKSPLDGQILGAEYAGLAVRHIYDLDSLSSLEEIRQFLDRNVSRGQEGFFPVSAAIYGKLPCLEGVENGEFYYQVTDRLTKSTSQNLSGFMEGCTEAKENFSMNHASSLTSFWQGHKDIPELGTPDSRSEQINPVRLSLYPWANQQAHCFPDNFPVSYSDDKISLGQILNLIYFQRIQRNFTKRFATELEQAVKDEKELFSPENQEQVPSNIYRALETAQVAGLFSKLEKMPKLSRAEIVQLNRALEALSRDINSGLDAVSDGATKRKLQGIRNYSHVFKKFLFQMDDQCADIDWIEEITSFNPSPAACLKP